MICPRCGKREAGLATSRLGAGINICTVCETEEAIEDMSGELKPFSHWYIPVPAAKREERDG